MKLGRKIRAVREIKNISQAYMAERLDIAQRTFSAIENDESRLTVAKLEDIARILEVPVSYILEFDPESSPAMLKSLEFTIQKVDDNVLKLTSDIRFIKHQVEEIKNSLNKNY
jgi:transcriptional regulator with XRE-family HTH domain